jgi:hypothetical protein
MREKEIDFSTKKERSRAFAGQRKKKSSSNSLQFQHKKPM